jgi:polyhydroxyalkanoate synthesis repressor PhaR
MSATEPTNHEPSGSGPSDPVPATGADGAVGSGGKPARVIKRYSNRKLYDTDSSKYVTLEEIARMIKAGDEVVIIDNKTKDDLTAITLTQIIYEEEKRKSRMPLGMLRQMITSSGDALQTFLDKQVVQPVAEKIDLAKTGVNEIRDNAIRGVEVATTKVTEALGALRKTESDIEKRVEEAVGGFETSFDELRKQLEAQLSKAEQDGRGAATRIVEILETRVGEMSQLVGQLRAKIPGEAAEDHTEKVDPPQA